MNNNNAGRHTEKESCKETALRIQHIRKLDAGHSKECITHAGHSIAFNMFYAL